MRLLSCTALTLILLSFHPAQAAVIGSGQTLIPSVAIQDITLLPGTPFNPTANEVIILNVSGTGLLAFNRNSQIGTTIVIPSLTGLYEGSNPDLAGGAPYRFGTITPAGQAAFSGSITNVIQDATDPGFATGDPSSFLSGDYQVSGSFFEFEIIGGPTLTTGPVVFNATFDGLPPTPGTIIDGGSQRVDIFAGNDIVGFSTNRQIVTAVPEPASGLLIGSLVTAASLCFRNRRRVQS